jgi:hypothetical protein
MHLNSACIRAYASSSVYIYYLLRCNHTICACFQVHMAAVCTYVCMYASKSFTAYVVPCIYIAGCDAIVQYARTSKFIWRLFVRMYVRTLLRFLQRTHLVPCIYTYYRLRCNRTIRAYFQVHTAAVCTYVRTYAYEVFTVYACFMP